MAEEIADEWERQTKRMMKKAFRFGDKSWEIALVGSALSICLFVLGSLRPTRVFWGAFVGIIIGYLFVEWFVDYFFDTKNHKVVIPIARNLEVRPAIGYVILLVVIVVSAYILALSENPILTLDEYLTLGGQPSALWETSLFWSVVASGALSSYLLRELQLKIRFRI